MNKTWLLAILTIVACTKSPVPGPVVEPAVVAPIPVKPEGQVVGNGGDHTRSTFIHVGHAIMDYLRATEGGKALAAKWNLDLKKLDETLTIRKISVGSEPLTDNGGNDVDALSENGLIKLRNEPWLEHFEKERDIYYLVFHEMLRAAGYNDDDNVISDALRPFPKELRVPTRRKNWFPIVGSAALSQSLGPVEVIALGSGCHSSDIFLDFDPERNLLDLSPQDMKAFSEPDGSLLNEHRSCGIAIPFQPFPGRRLVVTQIDVSGKVSLPSHGSASFNVEMFEAGMVGRKFSRTVFATDEPIQGRLQIRENETFETLCGIPRSLRLQVSTHVKGTKEAAARSDIDRITLYLRSENCD